MNGRGELVDVATVTEGCLVRVSPRIGFRPVLEVRHFPTLGEEEVDCYVVLYSPSTPGQGWENRARAATGPSTYRRDEASLRVMRAGELVEAVRPGGSDTLEERAASTDTPADGPRVGATSPGPSRSSSVGPSSVAAEGPPEPLDAPAAADPTLDTPAPSRHDHPSTSSAAAATVRTGSQRADVLLALRGAPALTDEEIRTASGHRRARTRRDELVQMGLVTAAGIGETEAGNRALTWTLTAAGQAEAARLAGDGIPY